MKPSIVLPTEPNRRWELASQLGVEHAVSSLPDTDDREPWAREPIQELADRFEDAGFSLEVIESRPPMDDIMTGGPEQDEQIEMVETLLESMGAADVPVWCSAWMARIGWQRTDTAVPDRGGSLVSEYDDDVAREDPVDADHTEADLWENLEYFLERVTPVAEEAGVRMALHPDDPPLSPVRGVERIITSVENYERMLDLYDSEYNGITFCQGNFAAMGADVPETIRRLGDRIHFAHFRDVRGSNTQFRETWHDDGPTDMLEAMRAYRDIGFDGVIRPDHVPTMAGEDNSRPGYHMKGRLWAVGYMRGLIEAVEDEAGG